MATTRAPSPASWAFAWSGDRWPAGKARPKAVYVGARTRRGLCLRDDDPRLRQRPSFDAGLQDPVELFRRAHVFQAAPSSSRVREQESATAARVQAARRPRKPQEHKRLRAVSPQTSSDRRPWAPDSYRRGTTAQRMLAKVLNTFEQFSRVGGTFACYCGHQRITDDQWHSKLAR